MPFKSGTLTYHTGYNYGASLQAYALQTVIARECGPNEIINYEPLEFLHSREMITRHPKRVKELVKIATRLRYARSLSRRQRLFDDFTAEQLKTTSVCRTRDEAVSAASGFDCLVCGSDQIWNLGAPGDEFAPSTLFFLDFPREPSYQRRVSYAASFGKWVSEADSRAEEFLPWLKGFDSISVREESGRNYLESKGIDCRVDIDPTLLLDAEDYRSIERKPDNIPERYILLFSWATTKDVVEAARRVSEIMGIPAINIVPPPRAMFSGIRRKLDVGPREFLWLVDNAEFVVTNSFHGTVFSSIFEKPYASIYRGKPDTRMESVLRFLGLAGRLVESDQVDRGYLETLDPDDYRGVAGRLEMLRAGSIEYLRENVR